MDTVVIVLLLAAAAVAVVVFLRRRNAARADGAAAPRRDPLGQVHGNEDYLRRLKVGDVVGHDGRDFLVRGSLRFDEDGFTWAEHLIADSNEQRWLSVEDDEGISVVLWERVGLSELDGEPGARAVRHGGESYTLQEKGEATYTSEGTTGAAATGTSRYADYRGPGERRLSCERFGQEWEVSVGNELVPRNLDVYPVTE